MMFTALLRVFRAEPALIGSVTAAVYGAATMLLRAHDHTGVFDSDLLVAAVAAVYGLYVRAKVTPVNRPRDRAGRPLLPR